MTDDRAPIAIALFWGAFIAILAFFGTKSTWYDTWKTSEQIDFWVAAGTLLLAAGTILLAWYTSRSVEITAHVLRDEQVRHQQGFAPLVVFTLTTPLLAGVYLSNLGKGLALNVTARFSIEFHPMIDPPQGSTFSPEEYGGPEPSVSTLKESYDFTVFVSVVIDEKSARARVLDEGLKKLRVLHPVFKSAVIEYYDMFGNRYETRYAPGSSTSFEWKPPPNLRYKSALVPMPPV
jgi:hypothetical protein